VDNVRDAVNTAVGRLLEEDRELLANDSNEQAITHRLAVHLGSVFPGWHVDCEYNRDMETVKRLKYRIDPAGELSDRAVVPDIIVHRRRTDDNFLVIEVKKSTNPEPAFRDLSKLRAFREQLGYRNALFLRLATGVPNPTVLSATWVNDT